ncbi:exosome complex RNA-binding protein Rrp4 [Vulcanisaeta souniana]|uniref:Exosome complex component Rrp4 n=1 Tax=Vulcanisaeta souniana JCM 11219 TaxID=1293586 RepID=A0A830E6G9_9CREN|nr:exosome complex RNA-binding protein Rrp4 [Vulcanisaeta souniana]BDR92111.1 RNA-binding protein [Vulcanisaeta souniana JCM 11219]GGI67803.1 RNA-binding protein [Vulcanisaeta souniana JCM 11219]
MPLYVSDRQIVLPGDAVATRDYNVGGSVYWDGDVAYSAVVGLVNVKSERDVEVIPLSGIYRPRVGDVVIGYIVDIGLTGWTVDIKSPYSAYLPVQEATLKPIDLTTVDLKDLLGIGDIVLARIIDFNLTRDYPVTLTLKEARLGRIEGGTLVEIDASKVARVIGRRGSMVGIFDEELNCDVTVGQNGRIWIRCRNPEDEPFVARVIKLIESESHTSGLTDRVKAIVSQYKEKKAGTKAQGSSTSS